MEIRDGQKGDELIVARGNGSMRADDRVMAVSEGEDACLVTRRQNLGEGVQPVANNAGMEVRRPIACRCNTRTQNRNLPRESALDMQPNGCIISLVDPDMDKVFKALADPGRRLLLDRLHAENGQTLGQLCEHLAMTRQAVTKHLKLLEEAMLVVTIRRGREKLHYLNPVPIHEIAERWIHKFEQGRLRVLAELKKQLEGKTDG